MKAFSLLLLLAGLLLLNINSYSQVAEQKTNTIKIKKTQLSPRHIGLRIFELYNKQAFDTLLIEYFPDQNAFLNLWKTGNLDTNTEFYQNAGKNFSLIKDQYMKRLVNDYSAAKAHVWLNTMKVDSVTFYNEDNTSSKKGKAWKLLFITVHCSDSRSSYEFKIKPLFAQENNWYLFETDLGYRQKEK